jgi:hypothetical protein
VLGGGVLGGGVLGGGVGVLGGGGVVGVLIELEVGGFHSPLGCFSTVVVL